MDSSYEPVEHYCDPNDLKPLDFDDDDEFEDEDPSEYFEDPYEDDASEQYEEPGLGGFDDLKPFGSFSDGLGWDDGHL